MIRLQKSVSLLIYGRLYNAGICYQGLKYDFYDFLVGKFMLLLDRSGAEDFPPQAWQS